MSANFDCPKCGSESTRSLSMVYAEGTSKIRATSVGSSVSFFGGGSSGGAFGGVGTSVSNTTTTGRQQTELAAAYAPPPQKPPHKGSVKDVLTLLLFTWIAVVMLFFGKMLVFAGAAALAVVKFLQVLRDARRNQEEIRRYNTEVWPGLQRQWEQSAVCQRCGTVFVAG